MFPPEFAPYAAIRETNRQLCRRPFLSLYSQLITNSYHPLLGVVSPPHSCQGREGGISSTGITPSSSALLPPLWGSLFLLRQRSSHRPPRALSGITRVPGQQTLSSHAGGLHVASTQRAKGGLFHSAGLSDLRVLCFHNLLKTPLSCRGFHVPAPTYCGYHAETPQNRVYAPLPDREYP